MIRTLKVIVHDVVRVVVRSGGRDIDLNGVLVGVAAPILRLLILKVFPENLLIKLIWVRFVPLRNWLLVPDPIVVGDLGGAPYVVWSGDKMFESRGRKGATKQGPIFSGLAQGKGIGFYFLIQEERAYPSVIEFP